MTAQTGASFSERAGIILDKIADASDTEIQGIMQKKIKSPQGAQELFPEALRKLLTEGLPGILNKREIALWRIAGIFRAYPSIQTYFKKDSPKKNNPSTFALRDALASILLTKKREAKKLTTSEMEALYNPEKYLTEDAEQLKLLTDQGVLHFIQDKDLGLGRRSLHALLYRFTHLYPFSNKVLNDEEVAVLGEDKKLLKASSKNAAKDFQSAAQACFGRITANKLDMLALEKLLQFRYAQTLLKKLNAADNVTIDEKTVRYINTALRLAKPSSHQETGVHSLSLITEENKKELLNEADIFFNMDGSGQLPGSRTKVQRSLETIKAIKAKIVKLSSLIHSEDNLVLSKAMPLLDQCNSYLKTRPGYDHLLKMMLDKTKGSQSPDDQLLRGTLHYLYEKFLYDMQKNFLNLDQEASLAFLEKNDGKAFSWLEESSFSQNLSSKGVLMDFQNPKSQEDKKLAEQAFSKVKESTGKVAVGNRKVLKDRNQGKTNSRIDFENHLKIDGVLGDATLDGETNLGSYNEATSSLKAKFKSTRRGKKALKAHEVGYNHGSRDIIHADFPSIISIGKETYYKGGTTSTDKDKSDKAKANVVYAGLSGKNSETLAINTTKKDVHYQGPSGSLVIPGYMFNESKLIISSAPYYRPIKRLFSNSLLKRMSMYGINNNEEDDTLSVEELIKKQAYKLSYKELANAYAVERKRGVPSVVGKLWITIRENIEKIVDGITINIGTGREDEVNKSNFIEACKTLGNEYEEVVSKVANKKIQKVLKEKVAKLIIAHIYKKMEHVAGIVCRNGEDDIKNKLPEFVKDKWSVILGKAGDKHLGVAPKNAPVKHATVSTKNLSASSDNKANAKPDYSDHYADQIALAVKDVEIDLPLPSESDSSTATIKNALVGNDKELRVTASSFDLLDSEPHPKSFPQADPTEGDSSTATINNALADGGTAFRATASSSDLRDVEINPKSFSQADPIESISKSLFKESDEELEEIQRDLLSWEADHPDLPGDKGKQLQAIKTSLYKARAIRLILVKRDKCSNRIIRGGLRSLAKKLNNSKDIVTMRGYIEEDLALGKKSNLNYHRNEVVRSFNLVSFFKVDTGTTKALNTLEKKFSPKK